MAFVVEAQVYSLLSFKGRLASGTAVRALLLIIIILRVVFARHDVSLCKWTGLHFAFFFMIIIIFYFIYTVLPCLACITMTVDANTPQLV